MTKNNYIGIDLFAGAGGMSIGAIAAGIDVKISVEIDKYAAYTYSRNHLNARMFNQDIQKFKVNGYLKPDRKDVKVLFGGPPCAGFPPLQVFAESSTPWSVFALHRPHELRAILLK